MSYPLGQPVHLTFETRNSAGAPTDPTEVTLTVTNSAGVVQTYTWIAGAQIVRDSIGLFHYDYPGAADGLYRFLWQATGAVVTSDDGTFVYRPSVQWRPDTTDVASYIPERTVALTAPGAQTPVGDFDLTTTPTSAQAEGFIDEAVDYITGRVGTVSVSRYTQALEAAAMRAAGLIELAYPTRQDDLNTGDRWIKLADDAISRLPANTDPSAPGALLPVFSFPDAPAYGDLPL
ncbi:MAG TPA: hypothetical protein VJX66_32035 [Amycolatopsis sp.]|nr:hypothetical protein [Amycolatopsis sp.]